MNVRRRFAAGAALMVFGLAAAGSGAAGANATTLVPGGGDAGAQLIVLGESSSAALVPLAVEQLFPRSSVTRSFRLELAGPLRSGRPAVVIDNVRDHERGCIHPEVAAGDTTCGDGDDQGELSEQLLAGITWAPADDAGCGGVPAVAPLASLRDLAGVTLSTDDAVSATGPDTCVTLTLALPLSADNLVQTDGATFDLRIGVVDSVHDGDAEVIGGGTSGAVSSAGNPHTGGSLTPAGRASLPGRDTNALPFTGLPLVPLLLLALGLLQLALVLLALGRRRAGLHPA